MTQQKSLNFADIQAAFGGANLQAHASEIHGLLAGIISAGFSFEDEGYLTLINDFFNNGEGLGKNLKDTVKQIYGDIWQSMLDDNFTFQLLVPDDEEAIVERGQALGLWVQGFNLGFGIQQKDKTKFSEEVDEIIKDFADIANLSSELEEDEDTEQAYFEILEYVRISALLCFAELAAKPDLSTPTNVLH